MSSNWGTNLKISLFGESHGRGIGVTIDGLPSGIPINKDYIADFMARRAPGKDKFSSPRKEGDSVEYLSGLYEGYTTGTPLTGIVFNSDTRSQDYKNMPPRPSHGDFTGLIRYLGYNDPRGGGHFSARLTAPLVFAGAIAAQVLNNIGVTISASIASVFTVCDNPPAPMDVTRNNSNAVAQKHFPVFDDVQGDRMKVEIEKARLAQDSLGGVVSCYVFGMPVGVGSPMFDGLENKLASILFGIPAVRGVEFGTGFAATKLKGSEHNDPFHIDKQGVVTTKTNHHGGILGGISSGMPIYFRVAFKPTPSISQKQVSIDLVTNTSAVLEIKGRHDPCVVPRAVPCVEAATALGLLDALLDGSNLNLFFNVKRKSDLD